MSETGSRPLIIGISGASGALLGVRALDACRELGVPTHLVISRAAAQTIAQETRLDVASVCARADVVHRVGDVGAAVASGSFPTRGMLIAPCSVRTMSEIATGVTSTLLTRAADVTLKERRPLVLMVRETPLHLGHLRTLVQLAEMGAVIAPPMPAFYAEPQTLGEIVDQSVGRALDLFGLSWRPVRRWARHRAGGPGSCGGTTRWRDCVNGEALWPFALERYGRPGVETAMLEAQDAHGQCAAYLLWALWLAETGRGSDRAALAAGAALARAWNETAVAPLRGLRRRLKSPLPPAPHDSRERLRKGVAELELQAERMLLEMLEASSPPATGAACGCDEALAMAAAVWGAELPPAVLDNMVKLVG